MSKDQEIRELFKRHGVPLDRDDVWVVQGTPVLKHKALERLGAVLGVRWHPPQVLRCERDEAVILVSGSTGDGPTMEWSIGEAVIGQNYRISPKVAAYPYAMAEKRGKDRVILKLAGLQGVYSEEEADDFKERAPEPSNAVPRGTENVSSQSRAVYVENSIQRIADFESAAELLAWAKTERAKVWPQYGLDAHDPDGQRIVNVYKDRMAVLESQSEAA
jgi:hypothetical protein